MADSSSEQSQHQHETADINGRSIVRLAIMLVVIIILISFILFGLITYFKNRQPVTFAQAQRETQKREEVPPLPHLEEKPGVNLKELRQEKEHLLHSYGWVDKKKGIIHIPIENAMKLLVMRKTSNP